MQIDNTSQLPLVGGGNYCIKCLISESIHDLCCATASAVETECQWSQRLPVTLHLALHPESLTLERADR